MSFDTRKAAFSREPFHVVELDQPLCINTFQTSPCVGGTWTITTTAVTTDDFTVGDQIQGGTSTAIGTITAISGSSPTYTFTYYVTGGTQFQTAAETITNISTGKTGVATKNGSAPASASSVDDKCFNTLGSCTDKANFDSTITTGAITVNVNASNKTFARTTGSFITDGFEAGQIITASGNASAGNNSSFIADTVTALVITVTDSGGMVTESGSGDEIITTPSLTTYKVCTNRSPLPSGVDAIPSLDGISISPAQIDIKGGLGVRSSVNVSVSDHPYSDTLSDPYVSTRTYNPLERGTFWTKFRARNLGYQNKSMRVKSGFIVGNAYDENDFITRHYVIDSIAVTGGKASITGKDPLKLASSKRATAPVVSTGLISNAGGINSSTTSITLDDASGYAAGEYICIDSEVIKISSITANTLTVVRAQYNTIAASHSENALAQICLVYDNTYLSGSGQVDYIVKDLLTNYAGISNAFIPSGDWASEASTYLSANLSGIVVKPTDVFKLLKEISEAQPHYLWWDERNQKIQLTALKAPPTTANALDMDSNLINLQTVDEPDMRVSTVIVNYGQYDPTKKLDEPTNYEAGYIREDLDSINLYESRSIKVINSRWIPLVQKAQAIVLSTLIGRRFSDIPRRVKFSLDPKDSDGASGVWAGQTRAINHRDILDFNGNPENTLFQIISAKESKNRFDFEGLEFRYGEALSGEQAEQQDIVYYSSNQLNVNLYDDFVTAWGAPTASTDAVFIVDSGAVIGSSSSATPSVQFGSWTTFNSITLIVDSGCYIVGNGGNGGIGNDGNGTNGGDAIDINTGLSAIGTITITTNGTIGGGGGGGAGRNDGTAEASGGGGAGCNQLSPLRGGAKGTNDNLDSGASLEELYPSEDGATSTGGSGAVIEYNVGGGETIFCLGGSGGNLGQAGSNAGGTGGSAGKAIDLNANSITQDGSGTVSGAVS